MANKSSKTRKPSKARKPVKATRKSGPAFVGPARGKVLPIREGSAMYAIASLMSRGASMETLEKANKKQKSATTVGQHFQHLRYRGRKITEKAGKYFVSPKV